MTATAANSSVRYAIDRWNRRIGAALIRGDDPPGPPALGGAARPPKPPWPDARIAAAETGGEAQAKGAPMRLFHLSIVYLTLLFAAVAVTALLPWGHW